MSFPKDRTKWRKRAVPMTAARHDAVMAAIRADPDNLEAIAERFNVGLWLIKRYAARIWLGVVTG